MKISLRILVGCVAALLAAMPAKAGETVKADTLITDTLITDTTRNEQLEKYLDQVFGKRPESQAELQPVKQKKRSAELHVLKLSGGVNLITSELQVGDYTYDHLLGLEYLAEYENIFDKGGGRGRGVAFTFKGNRYSDGYLHFSLYTFGVNRVWCNIPSTSRWRWELALGLGASYLHDKSEFYRYNYYGDNSKFGLSVLLKAGIEYRLSKHVGLGLETNSFYHIFFDSDSKMDGKPINGIVTTDVMLVPRIYF